MTKKKGSGGGGGQYHLPKHLRNSGGGGGGGGKGGGGSKSSSSSSSSSNNNSNKNDNTSTTSLSLEKSKVGGLTFSSGEELVSKVCHQLKYQHKTPEKVMNEGETLYLKYVYLEPEEGMKKKCTLLQTVQDKLYNQLFAGESFSSEMHITVNNSKINENVELLEEIQNVLSAISNQITHYENRAMLYKLGGLTSVCEICCMLRHFVPSIIEKTLHVKCCTAIENSLSALTFILFKIVEHTRGREILKQSGIFGALWNISQSYSQTIDKLTYGQNTEWYKLDSVVSETVISILYHIGEILNCLTEEYSFEDDLEKLLVSANPKWFPTSIGIVEKFGRITSDVHFAILDFPNLLDWSPDGMNLYLSESRLNLSVEDFDIHAHYSMIKARTGDKFLHQSNLVKWNPHSGKIENNSDSDYGPGYYILRLDHHPNNSLAFVKFIQFLYCGTIKKYQSDIEYLNNRVNTNTSTNTTTGGAGGGVDNQNEMKQMEIETCDSFQSYDVFVRNDNSKRLLQSCIPHYRESSLSSMNSTKYGCIYDDTDKVLFALYSITFSNGITDQYRKAYSKSLLSAKKISPINSDLAHYFSNIDKKNDLYYDIKLQTHGNMIDDSVKYRGGVYYKNALSSISDVDGILSHRFILASRSEYLRKVLEYETLTHNSTTNLDEFFIQDISMTTLFIINQYMCCGTVVFEKNPIPTECLIECFVVGDLYMLFGLKKFAEDRICSVLSIWKESFTELEASIVSASSEMELVEELYEIATVHLSVNMKYDCHELLKEYKPKGE